MLLPVLHFCWLCLHAQKNGNPGALFSDKGNLYYRADAQGNRVPDFSFCGYKASEEVIPNAAVKIIVPVKTGDATKRIQAALDYVAALPLDEKGIRGAVLLQKGTYEIFGQLQIRVSGVVLRGSGMDANGTTLLGAGTDRFAMVSIIGKKTPVTKSQTIKIADTYVPVNATVFHIGNAEQLDDSVRNIIIHRPSTKNWITVLGTDIFGGGISALGWKPGDHDLFFSRRIIKREGSTITIDVPITTAIDSGFGGGYIFAADTKNNIRNSGIEKIRCISSYDKNNLKDEDHRWNAIDISNAEDVWARQISFENFAGSAVNILETAKRVTVEDCISRHPVSEIGGQRRYTFFTSGQQTLFQRCYAENGYHDFATGFCAPGPNAFVQCESVSSFSFSGAIDSWASGLLFDVVNVQGNALRFSNRGQDANGAGWAAANSVFWNCSAARIDCYKPPTAQNWAFGCWSQFSGDGYWAESNNTISPRSLYYGQLKARLNNNVDHLARLLNVPTEASSSPSVETAMELTRLAAKPAMTLPEWILLSSRENSMEITAGNMLSVDDLPAAKNSIAPVASPIKIKNGWLVFGETILSGRRNGVQWWSGGVQGKDLENAKPHITRYVPGRTGKGLTDDLVEVADEMVTTRTIAIEHNYGLWYDRRRDDHQRVKRPDGEVWPPFYELPFARSGKDTAWDGLSKYDLTRYNPFYWGRLKQFADLADSKGLVLVHQNYFQHNIIEAGAHYTDFPWRTANNINKTGFPEPVPYAGDKRIFMAEQFYDTNDPVRKALHKKYIRQCLDNFKGNNNVIQLIGEEFTGPEHFVRFWLDVIREWEKDTGKTQLIGLSTTKDVQDAILANPAYASLIDIIDIRYWYYQADGSAYAPMGGQNLAPRQHARLLKPKKASFEQVYRAVKEYRLKYPGKAVIYSADNYPEFGIAAFMAGGSLPVLSANIDPELVNKASAMKPIDSPNKNEYLLSDGKKTIVYNTETQKLELR